MDHEKPAKQNMRSDLFRSLLLWIMCFEATSFNVLTLREGAIGPTAILGAVFEKLGHTASCKVHFIELKIIKIQLPNIMLKTLE